MVLQENTRAQEWRPRPLGLVSQSPSSQIFTFPQLLPKSVPLEGPDAEPVIPFKLKKGSTDASRAVWVPSQLIKTTFPMLFPTTSWEWKHLSSDRI